jgi:hypothetical protein
MKTTATCRVVAVLLGLCMVVQICSAGNKSPLVPLAQFRFDGDGKDATKANPAAELKNTSFKDNALHLNGKYEYCEPDAGYRAICKTPKLNLNNFAVAIRFKAEEFGPDRTNLLTGGTACRWFGMNRSDAGNLTITLNNQSFAHEIKGAAIEKGKWTVVACGVDISVRKVVVYVNGKEVASIDLPEGFKFEVIDSAFKDEDKHWSFSNYSNGNTFHGLVDELDVYGRMLSPEEFAQVSQPHGEESK